MSESLSNILKFLNKVEKLKNVKRATSIGDNSRKESPAEHTWRTALMAIILHEELGLDLDLLKALKIILVHDIVEINAGDVFITDNFDKLRKEKKARERKAAEEIYSILPDKQEKNLKDLWLEYESKLSREAKFASALDKIEAVIQRNNMGGNNWETKIKEIHGVILRWSDKDVENFPKLKEFWGLVQDELLKQIEINKNKIA